MPILIDGNNLLHRIGDRTRVSVRKQVLDVTRYESMSVTVIFDGPAPTGSPQRESLGRVTIVYSGSKTADDVIVEMVPVGSAAKQWSVVTDDRGLADRVKDRGGRVRTVAQWRGRRTLPSPAKLRVESKLSSHDVADWEAFFAGSDRDDG